jgi:phosphoribosylglycinamide formyltransferase-1
VTNRVLGILISGRGSNLQAIIRAIETRTLDARIAVVVSNRPEAAGLAHAREAGIETIVIDHRSFPSRDAFDQELANVLIARRVGLVCLAGFMRLLGSTFLDRFPNGVLNIHPSLLPAFPGLDAQAQAIAHGVKVSGATVHFVSPELDAGPIVLQRAVPVLENDTNETLAARILTVEHAIYPEAIGVMLDGGWRIEDRRFVREGRAILSNPS